ncbi:MAG: AMP-binding protein [Candidatus Helarchaeota archaeon]|nr:AMP-binding protein [Candidatus Helarchaeota archaeon]
MSYADKPWLKSYKMGPFKLPQTMAPYPEISIYQFLEDSAKDYPDNTAIVYLDKSLTYSQLKLQVDKLATALAELGVKKGDSVATVLPNCLEFVICDYAIMRLGAIHVPISVLHRKDDLLYELGESKPNTIISSYRRVERVMSIADQIKFKNLIYVPVSIFPDYTVPKIKDVPDDAIRLEDLIANYEPNPPEVKINPKEDMALLPFTGGTTGLPKGTMITHYNVTCDIRQVLHWMLHPLKAGVKGKSSIIACVPMFHQFGHFALHGAISWGLRLFIMDPRDIDRIVETIIENRPFMVLGVPTHFTYLLNKQLPRMQVFFYSAAAALPVEVAEQMEKKSGIPMGEGYGATETCGGTHINLSAFSKVTGFMASVKKASIGVPVPDTDVKIVDLETGEEVPFGESGEIWIHGPQVMKGYWPTPGKGLVDGWLPTGDVAKMDEDGYFYIVDRIKDMINVSGNKVYSRVVDEVIHDHPAVSSVGVIGIPDPKRIGSERVKAFIALKPESRGKVTEEEIIEFCKEKLPPYAVPKEVEFRKSLPLTLVMKINKKKLREEEEAKGKD